MALGDGIRYNIASVDPAERAMLRDALVELNRRHFPGNRSDSPIGGVSWWFKQDETHQSTHVHGGPEFVPWHREIVNRFEQLIRQVNPQLSLHYWDWTQDPRSIPNSNLGGGNTGSLNLFTADFMGHGGSNNASIGPPWQNASAPWRSDGFYVPDAANHRDATNNPFDPPQDVKRSIGGSPASVAGDTNIVNASDYAQFRQLLEQVHNAMHGFVAMGGQHISFRDPFVFFLHSNVDRLFAKWQTQANQTARLDPTTVYGSESADPELNTNLEPWSGGLNIRPWAAPDNQQFAHNYKHPSVVFPPCYDTNGNVIPLIEVLNAGSPPVINFVDVPTGETRVVAAVFRVYTCTPATIRIKAGAGPTAPYSVMQPASGQLVVNHGSAPYAEARVWLALVAGALGAVPDGSVTFECPESGKQFVFVLKANVIARPTVAVMLALDQSGSMAWEAGTTGVARLDVLKNAATSFMELLPMNNAVGLIRFDHDAYPTNHATFPGLPMTTMPSNDINPARIAAMGAVAAHQTNVNGNTSIGDGVQLGRQTLDAIPAGSFDQKALIVLTDGLETAPLYIADVAGSINNRTYAIGLGNEQQVNTAALRALANGTGGYLALTGLLSGSIDDYFRLRKYFQQILAAVTNTNIIVDPSGYIGPGNKIRIPFNVTEADIDCTAIVMMDFNVIDFGIETPSGNMI